MKTSVVIMSINNYHRVINSLIPRMTTIPDKSKGKSAGKYFLRTFRIGSQEKLLNFLMKITI